MILDTNFLIVEIFDKFWVDSRLKNYIFRSVTGLLIKLIR